MFESIFEPAGSLQGPYRGSHDRITEQMPLIEVLTNQPMWMYHRHERNLDGPFSRFDNQMQLNSAAELISDFGLDSMQAAALTTEIDLANGAAADAMSTGWQKAFRPAAEMLRNKLHWSPRDREKAIELASASGLDELSRWLAHLSGEAAGSPVNAGLVFRSIEERGAPFLNGTGFAHLAGHLAGQKEIVAALQASDYAVALMPGDRHIRARRDHLASTLMFDLDGDEQLAIADLLPGLGHIAKRLLFLASESLPVSGTVDACILHDRAMEARRCGFEVYVITLLWHPGQATPAITPIRETIDGIHYERLSPPAQWPDHADELRRTNVMLVADRVASLRPGALATDGAYPSSVVAATIGRAFGLDVSFAGAPWTTLSPGGGPQVARPLHQAIRRHERALPHAPRRSRRVTGRLSN